MTRRSLPATAPRSISSVIQSWALQLADSQKTPRTRTLYLREAHLFEAWLAEEGVTTVAGITPEHCRSYALHLFERGLADTTRNLSHRCLQVFLGFAVQEGVIEATPLAGLRAPKIDTEKSRRFQVPTDDSLNDVYTVISKDAHKLSRTRDTAVLRLFQSTGMRLGELAGLQLNDIDLGTRIAHVSGKTGWRAVRFDPKAARAIDRYLVERDKHYCRDSKALWLSRAGAMTASGLGQMVRERGLAAGVALHPHQFRHRFANEWLKAGGSEIDLQYVAGWRSGQMVRRYSDFAGAERALAAYDKVLGGE